MSREQFEADCKHWRGQILTGKKIHWCYEYDELPVDETCPEWPCGCDVRDGELEGHWLAEEIEAKSSAIMNDRMARAAGSE